MWTESRGSTGERIHDRAYGIEGKRYRMEEEGQRVD